MHELAICRSIVDNVQMDLDEMEILPSRLRRVKVAAGALRQIEPESMALAYGALTKETALAESSLAIRVVPVKALCRKCGREQLIELNEYRCSACEGTDLTLTAGQELLIEALEVEET